MGLRRTPNAAIFPILNSAPFSLDLPLDAIPPVGPVRAALFARLDILTAGDLLFTKPRRYEDRRLRPPDHWEEGAWTALRFRPAGPAALRRLRFGRAVVELRGACEADPSQAVILRWFNVPYLAKTFTPQPPTLCVFGKLKRQGRRWMLDMPEWEIVPEDEDRQIHTDRIVPIYSTTEGLGQRLYRAVIFRTLRSIPRDSAPWRLPAAPPIEWRDAVDALHFPSSRSAAEIARRRLAFDEFLVWQTAVAQRRARARQSPALPIKTPGRLAAAALEASGLTPTQAQARALREILADMRAPAPMNRLLQGDVGSGKTLVAALAMLHAAEAGATAVLMAPTEILARQHHATLKRLVQGLGLEVGLFTGSEKSRPDIFFQPRLWTGTHALFQDNAPLENLALAVIDEQHKFGVEQRARLRAKGRAPHTLVMTATPIPRTLALTVYGGLDVSVIDELPRGRGPLLTAVRSPAALEKIWDFVKAECAAGRQAYVVYPHIESAAAEIKTVRQEAARLRQRLAPHTVAELHGRLDPEARDAVMRAFRDGRAAVLVATTVIEVGVDVPNASVIVIENAERFGLAQLHQLRGRVGRGAHKSWCVLVTADEESPAWRRLKVLEQTRDGFRIAEADLQLRGTGDLMGKLQSGAAPFRLGNLHTDLPIIRAAQLAARELVNLDPALTTPANLPLRARVHALQHGNEEKWIDAA